MTFSCPHYDIDKDTCWRLKTECVPGRPGCVMRNNSRFAVPAEQRVAEAREATRRKAEAGHREACGHPECPQGTADGAKTPATGRTTAATKAANMKTKQAGKQAARKTSGKERARSSGKRKPRTAAAKRRRTGKTR